jgi:hypothetical protein
MTGARGEGRGARGLADSAGGSLDQIEYLLQQSTQGLHFIFDHHDVANVLRKDEDGRPLDIKLMDKVQGLLTGLLGKHSITEKRSFLESLPRKDYELLVKAYFQLVDKTILANSQLRH